MGRIEQQREIMTTTRLESLFRQCTRLDESVLPGVYEATIMGAGWLRLAAKLSLPFAGLPGWYGKKLEEDGAFNLLRRGVDIVEGVAMTRSIEESWIDGNDCLVLSYESTAPALLRPMRDEFRQHSDDLLLGISTYNLKGLRGIRLPFTLRRVKA